MMVPLVADKLSWDHCESLAQRVSSGDFFECLNGGVTPVQALAAGCMEGTSYSALREATGTPVGAFGFTAHDTIWSLWAPLSRSESLQILRATPEWVSGLLRRSGRSSLYNFVHVANGRALRWLRASKCFAFGDEAAESIYFETLPLSLLSKMVR